MKNPLAELGKVGQSVWYDQMESALITKGTLKQMIEEDDLRGLTSNPTIFEKAIGGSSDYDEALGELARMKHDSAAIYEALVVNDIARAADLFLPVYAKTGGKDGYVSLEVSPTLARDTAGTIAEGKKLFALLGRRNVMIKVPATDEGIPAIEELIASGINVNVTLIFSQEVYARVIEAYLAGLERRHASDLPLSGIASVASFFVSRIDAKVDKALEARISASNQDEEKTPLTTLLGRIAIANAKVAYSLFQQQFSGERFERLKAAGAAVQRPLWASTGTKNKSYRDVLYIEELIGEDTVNTVPPATYAAFKDHGNVRGRITEGIELARQQLDQLKQAGISLEAITSELTDEGVKSFSDSFVSLMATIEARRLEAIRPVPQVLPGALRNEFNTAMARINDEKLIERIWKRDASVWKSDELSQKLIANSLGWLNVAEQMEAMIPNLRAFTEKVRARFDHVVVLGMGGSSLCAEVLRTSFDRPQGFPRLHVLDSTVPAAVRALESELDLQRTLFLVASKSGTTTEPQMFYRYFYSRMQQLRGEEAGEHFVAITDPGTELENEARSKRFLQAFINPPDIGGRYSALSLFGLVPATLSGIDPERFLASAHKAMKRCATMEASRNEAAVLGALIGAGGLAGRDKLTIVTDGPFAAFGLWVEQLVAESTGKEGKGIVPIAGETLASGVHGQDRVIVNLGAASGEDFESRGELTGPQAAPEIRRPLTEPYEIAGEFFVWEMATAIAGAVMRINPFDQPNVQESKDNTRKLLAEYAEKKAFAPLERLAADGTLEVFGGSAVSTLASPRESVEDVFVNLLQTVRAGDYVAVTQYIPGNYQTDSAIQLIRNTIGAALGVATTTGYGPRFLHSTGQLHKGGGDNGVFIQITADDTEDVAISGEQFTFGTLKEAQSLGDFQSLDSRGRRAVRVNLGRDVQAGLANLNQVLQAAVARIH